MLAKLTSKNPLTLPKAAIAAVAAATEYFDVETRNGATILTPVRIQRGDAVRAWLAELALQPADIDDAVDWARCASHEIATARNGMTARRTHHPGAVMLAPPKRASARASVRCAVRAWPAFRSHAP